MAKEGGERLKTSRFFTILPINRDFEVIFFCILANRKRQIVIRSRSVLAVRLKPKFESECQLPFNNECKRRTDFSHSSNKKLEVKAK